MVGTGSGRRVLIRESWDLSHMCKKPMEKVGSCRNGMEGMCDVLGGITVSRGRAGGQPRPSAVTSRLTLGLGESWTPGEKEEVWKKEPVGEFGGE